MRLKISILLLAAIFASSAEEKKETKAQPKPKDAMVEAVLPEGAKEIAPFTWRYTDPQGKTWIYRRTVFGLAKFEEKADKKTEEAEAPANIRAFEEGDSIRFERPTPFGVVRWIRKKAELNDAEQAVWDRERRGQPEKPAAKDSQKETQ